MDITHKTELSSFSVRYRRIRGVTYITEFNTQNLSALTHVAFIFHFFFSFFLKVKKNTKQPYVCLIFSVLPDISQRCDVLSSDLSTVRIPESLIQKKKEVVQKRLVWDINKIALWLPLKKWWARTANGASVAFRPIWRIILTVLMFFQSLHLSNGVKLVVKFQQLGCCIFW